MNKAELAGGFNKTLIPFKHGQSMVEFALILPLFVLFILGIFELGRAFFAYIAITNAAREGVRVITFWPGKTTGNNVVTAIDYELGNSPMVKVANIASRVIQCGTGGVDYVTKTIDGNPLNCESGRPVRVTVTYNYQVILKLLFPNTLVLKRSVEMMEP